MPQQNSTIEKNEKSAEELELIISTFLRIGVILSSIVILTGLLMFLISGHSGYAGNYYPTKPIEILKGCKYFKPYAIMLFGLLILMAIPVLRVAVSILVFFKEGDYLYVKITSLVLVILLCSILMGKVG
ncbi:MULTISPECIES: DUF1634 domain-containing protein [Clostridium]|uniref:DUF1634 domain-containing protein n=3 Tax=Clostridium TaxID=1485 RepID=D8GRL0_CLOLD|nr:MULTISPECIES: DUF1634 domain-containing protein [Clostridium]ADK16378.1 conserved hypothetical protein [Clostridium ljungdahlii DSM 13528]AGY75456.1 DUF1634 domain-containing protein [Clostridium autoethanogenum DSM 10061]ALU35622.1 Hypothetical protein CLAU_1193 [Clostridium autoethanogenum DSM 10061]OAA89747.1 hypothetical protein WX45_01584 [Clostridium ljungdahlii DSM 13528]OAA94639.1 hypothetical protein WX73_02351 [Clostridium coskatii]